MATEGGAGQIDALVVGESSYGSAKHLLKDQVGAVVRVELGAEIRQSAGRRQQDPIACPE
jgi:hypothetical protein